MIGVLKHHDIVLNLSWVKNCEPASFVNDALTCMARIQVPGVDDAPAEIFDVVTVEPVMA